jgi:hypothetical protein
MITLQDHIDELRAELRGCLDRRERAEIAAELESGHRGTQGAGPRRRGQQATRMREEATLVTHGLRIVLQILLRIKNAQECAFFVAGDMAQFGQPYNRMFIILTARRSNKSAAV